MTDEQRKERNRINRQRYGHVSVAEHVYARLNRYCDKHNESMSSLIERFIESELGAA